MKGKYVTKQILLACLVKPQGIRKDIHAQLAETIAERRRILPEWERLFLSEPSGIKQDIHAQLAETIAEHRRIMKQWNRLFSPEQDSSIIMQDKKAA